MEPYQHFSLASYMYAYYIADKTDEELRQGIETYLRAVPLKKVYVENHRATTDIPEERLPGPHHRNDGAKTRETAPEYAYLIPMTPGQSRYLQVMR